MNQFWLAFITGLTSGAVSCLAVQGGLLATSVSQLETEKNVVGKKAYIASFLLAKLVTYTLLGAGLGFIGSALVISPKLLGTMQIAAGVFMLLTAARLLDVHPFFRKFTITPPKFFYKLVRNESKKTSLFAPAALGGMTVLIPCGVTQAMMALAVASTSPVYGAGIMFAFTLGTSPIFFAAGMAAVEILKRKSLVYIASSAIVILGFVAINTGQVLRGSVHTFQNYWSAISGDLDENIAKGETAVVDKDGYQVVNVNVLATNYKADVAYVKSGTPVKMNLITNNTFGCSRAFTIPQYNISKILPETGTETVEFTPTRKGRLTFTCSMGMYSGYIEVI
jgi:uncharacterized protein